MMLQPTIPLDDRKRALLLAGAPGRRPHILLSAYTASPCRGSEPAVGWNIALRLASACDVTVLCSPECEGEDYRSEIEAYLYRNGPVPGLAFHYVTPPLRSRWLQVSSSSPLRPFYYIGYAAWQRAAYREALRLHRQWPFDLIHQFNISGYREPGYLWKLDVPFVWGPIGGADNLPWPFFSLLSWRDRIFYTARNLANLWQMRKSRRCRLAAGRASIIWTIGEGNQRMVRHHWGRESCLMLETGATLRPEIGPRIYDVSRPLQLVWSGVHIGRKMLPVLLHAMATLKEEPTTELTVLGSGNLTGPWQALAERLSIARQVRWLGNLPHQQAIKEMSRANVLAFTSVLEGMPHTILEALSLGLPVICHDTCGMGVAINDGCGIKIPVENPETSIRGFAAAIRHLAGNPEEVHRLSHGALARAAELSWDAKTEQIAQGYAAVLSAVSQKQLTRDAGDSETGNSQLPIIKG